ncbi:MAG: class IV adenylate cyclase [Pyrinomonadaceae bacterium]
MGTEIEKKYRVTEAQARALRTRLEAVAVAVCGPEFEVNTLYAGHGLDPQVCVLRLRRVGGRAVLTYKERRISTAAIKHHREDETEVADADALATILEALGYSPALVYEKRRATWRLAGAEVMLDELPFGWFVEIEGSEDAIMNAEGQLDLGGAEVEHATYPELTTRFVIAHGTLVEARFASDAL